jgi:PEP-CTERM motif
MNCLTTYFIKNERSISNGKRIMIKTPSLFQRGIRKAGIFASLSFACLFLAAPGAHAQAGALVANAIKHAVMQKITGGHKTDLYNSPLDNAKMMEVVPEPSTPALLTLGSFIGLAAWRVRRRSTRNRISQ